MKKIHPKKQTIKATCSCGDTFNITSTKKEDVHLDVCSNCHPAYTGIKKNLDSTGQVEKFKERMKKAQSSKSKTQKPNTKNSK